MPIVSNLEFGIRIGADASQTVSESKKAEEALKGIGKGARDAASDIDSAAKSVGKLVEVGVGLYALKQAFDALSGLSKITDEFKTVESRLSLVTASTTALTAAQQRLFQIAQTSRVSYSALGETYARMATATKDLGISQSRLLAVTETVSKAMTISGGSAESMRAALVQLSQGLASGTLRGEELNSVLEQAPRLAQAIAEGMGKSVGELRKLGEAGKITSAQIVESLEKSAPSIAQEFAKITPTVSSSFTALRDAFGLFVSELDKGTGTSASLAGGMIKLADSLTSMATVAKDAGATLKPVIDVAAWTAFGLAAGGALSTVIGWVTKLKGLTLNPITIAITLGAAAVGAVGAFNESEQAANNGVSAAQFNLESVQRSIKMMRRDLDALIRDGMGGTDEAQNLFKGLEAATNKETEAVERLRKANERLWEMQQKPLTDLQKARDAKARESGETTNQLAAEQEGLVRQLQAAAAAYGESTKGVQTAAVIQREYEAELKKTRDAHGALLQAMVARGATDAELNASATEQNAIEAALTREYEKRIKALDANQFAQSAMLAASQAMVEAHATLTNEGQKLTASEKKLLDLQTDPRWASVAQRDREIITAKLQWAAADEKQAIQNEVDIRRALKLGEAWEGVTQAERDAAKAYTDMLVSEREQNRLVEVRLSTIGMEETQAARLNTIARAMVGIKKAEANEDYILAGILRERLELELGILTATKETADAKKTSEFLLENEKRWLADQVKLAEQLQTSITDALLRAFESGKDAAASLRDTIKNMFKTLVLRPIVQAVVQTGVGALGLAGSAGASALGGGGVGGNGFGSLLSAGSSLMGGGSSLLGYGGLTGALSGSGGIFGAGAIGSSFALGETGAALGLSAVADTAGGMALTTLGATLGAAIPIIGAIIAVLAMSGAFSSKGGPKYGGFAQTSNLNLKPFFDSSEKNSDVGKIVGGASTSYANLARLYGFTPGEFQFALGFDSDPAGTAPNRISAGASLNGQSVITQRIAQDVGRDEGKLTEELGNVAAEAVRGALLASDLPKAVKDLLSGFDGTAVEFEAYANKIAGVNALLNVANVGLAQMVANFDIAGLEKFTDLLGGVAPATEALGFYIDNFYTEAERTTLATETLQNAFTKLGLTMPSLSEGADTARQTFRELIEAARAAGNSELLAGLLQLAPALDALIDPLDQLQDAAEDLGDTITEVVAPSIFASLDDLAANAARMREEQDKQRESLMSWLNGLLVGDLSTLSPELKLSEARTQYFSALRGGDASSITRSGDTYLRLARGMYGSGSGYNSIFATVREQASAVAAGQSVDSLLRDSVVVQTQIRDGVQEVAKQVQTLGSNLFNVWQYGPPTTATN